MRNNLKFSFLSWSLIKFYIVCSMRVNVRLLGRWIIQFYIVCYACECSFSGEVDNMSQILIIHNKNILERSSIRKPCDCRTIMSAMAAGYGSVNYMASASARHLSSISDN